MFAAWFLLSSRTTNWWIFTDTGWRGRAGMIFHDWESLTPKQNPGGGHIGKSHMVFKLGFMYEFILRDHHWSSYLPCHENLVSSAAQNWATSGAGIQDGQSEAGGKAFGAWCHQGDANGAVPGVKNVHQKGSCTTNHLKGYRMAMDGMCRYSIWFTYIYNISILYNPI